MYNMPQKNEVEMVTEKKSTIITVNKRNGGSGSAVCKKMK